MSMGNLMNYFRNGTKFLNLGYTEGRLRVFCECLEEVGKDAKPELITH